MGIQISGVSLGTITGGPSALNLSDLHDVLIVSPLTSQYLRYNATISEWQNAYLNADVYNYLSTGLSGSNGIVLTPLSGPQTIDVGLSLTASGDAVGTTVSGNLPLTLATVNSNVGTFGSGSSIPVVTVNAKGLVTAVTTISFGGNAPLATSLAGGTVGALPYQSAVNTTAFLTAGTSSQVLVSGTSPTWTNTPTLTGTNFTGIPNTGLTNSAITIGSTPVSLGATATTIAGLTSVTSTTFVGSVTGHASLDLPLSGGSMSGTLTIPTGQIITIIDQPTIGTSAANKNYVDAIAAGLTWKNSVVAGTTVNITLSAPQTIDGVAVVAGNRVLVKNQTTTSENGIYVVAAGAWVRSTDMDSTTPLNEFNGAGVLVTGGTTQNNTSWTVTSTVTVVGTSPVTWAQFNGAAGITAGTGLTITGNTLSVNASQTQITALGTVTTGTWSGLFGAVSGANLTNITGSNVNGTVANATNASTVTTNANLTGPIISVGNATSVASQTGTGSTFVMNTGPTITSPTLVTPNIGVATGTSFNSITGLSVTTPAALGTAAVGVGTTAARSDHVHAIQTTVSGNAGTVTNGVYTTDTGTVTNTMLAGSIANTKLINSSITVAGGTGLGVSGSPVSLGGTVTLSNTGVTSIVAGTNISISGSTGAVTINTTGTVPTATTATNVSGGAAGSIPYQTAPNTTAMLAAGTGVLVGGATPSYSTTPTLTGTNFTGIPNGALNSSSTTINGTSIALGASGTVTAAAGTLTGTTLNATVVSSSLTSVGTLTSLTTSGMVNINSIGWVDTSTLTTSTTTAGQVVDSNPIASYRVVSYKITITSGSAYAYTEVNLMHDGTNVYMTESNSMNSGAALATFTADISAGNLRLLTTPVNAVTVYKVVAILVAV